jgi:hypothetical protein
MSITKCTKCGANSFEAHAGEHFTGSVDEHGTLRLGDPEVDDYGYLRCTNCKNKYGTGQFADVVWS